MFAFCLQLFRVSTTFHLFSELVPRLKIDSLGLDAVMELLASLFDGLVVVPTALLSPLIIF